MFDFQIPQVRPVTSGASGPKMDWRPFFYALPVAGVLIAAHTVEAVSSIALRASVWGMDGVISVMAEWLGRHDIDAGADVFAGISIIASAIGATYVIGKQVKGSLEARKNWERTQAAERAKLELHSQTRGAAIDALVDASKDFSSVFIEEARPLIDEVKVEHEKVFDDPENILMAKYNGELEVAHRNYFDDTPREGGGKADFNDVPDIIERCLKLAQRTAQRAEAIDKRVVPFFDALKLEDDEISEFRNAVIALRTVAMRIENLLQVSRVWEKYRNSPSGLSARKSNGGSAESGDEAGRPDLDWAAKFVNAIGSFGAGNPYVYRQMQWFVDSVEGGRGDMPWNSASGETYNQEFWDGNKDWCATTEFSKETARQYLSTHFIRSHEWHLGELSRLMALLDHNSNALLARLAGAVRAIADDGRAETKVSIYASFIEKYFEAAEIGPVDEIREQPISRYGYGSKKKRLADQGPDEIAERQDAENEAAYEEAMKDVPLGRRVPKARGSRRPL